MESNCKHKGRSSDQTTPFPGERDVVEISDFKLGHRFFYNKTIFPFCVDRVSACNTLAKGTRL